MAEIVVQLHFGVYWYTMYIGPIQMECFIGKWQENMVFKAKSLIQDIYGYFFLNQDTEIRVSSCSENDLTTFHCEFFVNLCDVLLSRICSLNP